jgi:hypothetical protein
MAVVYIHMEPTTRDIYYIGIGNNISRAYHYGDRNDHWKKTYNKHGIIVDIISSDISLEAAKEMEKHLIASIGLKSLCNKTAGGEGFFGGRHTEETKEKIRQAKLGTKLSEETKRKIGKKSKGRKGAIFSHTEEAKKKISKAFKGKKRSEYFCKRVKESKQGYKPSEKAILASAKARKEKAVLIKELSTGYIGKIWDIEEKFNIDKRAVYRNYKNSKPIIRGNHKGLNFIKK